MMELRNVEMYFGKQHILKNTNLKIKEQKITALIGANGAGKSTLFNVAANLLKPRSGQVLLDGRDITTIKPEDIAKQIAILKQTQHLSLRVTVRELVAFGRYPHCKGRLKEEDEQKIEQALQYLNLQDLQDRFIDELSGGQRQRAYIAMIMAQDTKYIFLDEPLNNLDMKYSVEMMEILCQMVDKFKKTVIIVIHDINMAASYADEIVAMKDGVIIKEGSVREVVDGNVLKAVFDYDFHIREVDGKKVCVYPSGRNSSMMS